MMELKRMGPSEIESLPQAFAFIDELLVILAQQQERIVALEAEVKRLQEHQTLDSHTRSLPPSTDKGRQKRPSSQSLRQKSGRQPGGQHGHKGATRTQVDRPDHIIFSPVSVCSGCGHAVSQVPASGVEKRQVFDRPPLKLAVIEHQAEIKTCPHCAQSTTGEFPSDVSQPVQSGPRVKGLLVYLNQAQLIPSDRTTTLGEDLFGQPVSQGTLLNTNQRCYARLAAPEAQIKQDLHQADVVHFDETGLYEKGRRIWLHSASTASRTYYFAHDKRGKVAMEAADILPNFDGTAVHDHWEAYQAFDTCDHAFCKSHHVRELNGAIEHDEAAWAKEMKALLLEINATVASAKAQGAASLSPEQLDQCHARYRDIVDRGLTPYRKEPPANAPPTRGRKKQSNTKNLLDRFDTYQTETLRFMTDFRVPFDNNQAERDLRMTKVKQKISGPFRSENGTQYFCRIRGYLSTLKKQGQNILDALTQTFIPNQTV